MSAGKFLVAGPSWVGDMVMAQSLFLTLRERHPGCTIDVLAPEWSHPLLDRMPEVGKAIAVPIGHGSMRWGVRRRIGVACRGEEYDRAIVIPRSWKAALIPFFARVPVRTGFRGEMRFGLINDVRPLDKSTLPRAVERFVALGLDAGQPLPPPVPEPRLETSESNAMEVARGLGADPTAPAVAMMPGAEYGPAKQWPAESFGDLARRLNDDGLHVWLLGSEKDRPVAERIVQRAGTRAVHDFCGKTRLQDAVDLLAVCAAGVTNDSGLMHVMAAVDRPVVAIYGSSTPDYTPPLSAKATVIYLRLDCSPCFERVCPLGHTRCLGDVTVDRVRDAVRDALE